MRPWPRARLSLAVLGFERLLGVSLSVWVRAWLGVLLAPNKFAFRIDPTSKKKIFILLKGGLGNQLAQLAVGLEAAKSLNRTLTIDTSLLHSKTRHWRGITPRTASSICQQLAEERSLNKIALLLARASSRLPSDCRWLLRNSDLDSGPEQMRLKLSSPHLQVINSDCTSPLIFDQPFTAHWRQIKEALPPRATTILTGVHLRRGDYLKSVSGFTVLPISYYKMALRLIFQLRPDLDHKVKVFTDDHDWAAKNLCDSNWDIEVEIGTPEEDLSAMSQMEALVISNSSFSAIAAHLGETFGALQLVICPNQWLSDPSRKALGDLRKPSWISLPIQP